MRVTSNSNYPDGNPAPWGRVLHFSGQTNAGAHPIIVSAKTKQQIRSYVQDNMDGFLLFGVVEFAKFASCTVCDRLFGEAALETFECLLYYTAYNYRIL